MTTPIQLAALVAAAFAAGAVNSIAGGGTLLTFPALLAAGISPLAANATSTVAVVPGSLGAFWAYRGELHNDRAVLVSLAIPSALGGVAGALLALRAGDALFAALVPWLILGATALFLASEPISRWLGRTKPPEASAGATQRPSPRSLAAMSVFQFAGALYGGFFGAGIGILMLAALGIAGMRNVHRMNAFKNFAAACINGIAAVTFAARGRVIWWIAGVMALAAIAGGVLGARAAKKVGQRTVRQMIVAVGVIIAAVMFMRR
ncbi:MAG: sulfite exporter TauE/SafE family protein [Deltaproteobacteria bacterium]